MRASILPVLLMVLLSGIAAYAQRDETGDPAPRFRARTLAGEQFNNQSTKGKVVLFEFWTTWCKYCEDEAQLVDDIAKEFKGKDLIVLAVDVLEPDQKVKKYLVEHPRSVPIVLTKDTNLAAMYNAQVYRSMLSLTAREILRQSNVALLANVGFEESFAARDSIQTPNSHSRRVAIAGPVWLWLTTLGFLPDLIAK